MKITQKKERNVCKQIKRNEKKIIIILVRKILKQKNFKFHEKKIINFQSHVQNNYILYPK